MTKEELDRNLAEIRVRIQAAPTIAELEVVRADIWPDLAKDCCLDHMRRLEVMKDYNAKYAELVEIEYPYPWPNKAA